MSEDLPTFDPETDLSFKPDKRPSAPRPPASVNQEFESLVDKALTSVGAGNFYTQANNFLVGLDRYQRNILPGNVVHSGLTFITRPRLNLQESSLLQDREFAPLNTTNPTDMQFMIRCLLDTKFSRESEAAKESPLIDHFNPFMTPLCNALMGISGFPDPVIQSQTTDTGFHSEDQSAVLGYDYLNRTYDLNLSFKDIQHGPIAAILKYWLQGMANISTGVQSAYIDDINARRLNYTCSIYRFTVDPSRRFVVGFSKATGCYPKTIPEGSFFNFSKGELHVNAAQQFSAPFVANKVEYNDYGILMDFNYLMQRYCPHIKDAPTLSYSPVNNWHGLPWIDTSNGSIQIVYKDVHERTLGEDPIPLRRSESPEDGLATPDDFETSGKYKNRRFIPRKQLNGRLPANSITALPNTFDNSSDLA